MMTTLRAPLHPLTSPSWRQTLPKHLLSVLPLTLFFQVGVMYAGLVLFLLAWAASGQWPEKWQRVRQSSLFWPVMALSCLSIVLSVYHPRPAGEFLSSWLHYQSYWILLAMLSVAGGAWQRRAVMSFFAGAVIASTLFFLNNFGYLPKIALFKSYMLYEGNKSILLGLLLAMAAAWMLHEWRVFRNHHVVRAAAFVYVSLALILCAKSRTATLLLLLLMAFQVGVWASASVFWRRCYWLLLVMTVVLTSLAWREMLNQPAPVTCLAKEMQDKYGMNGLQITVNRGICTAHQLRDFGTQGKVSEDGMRLELYRHTWEMIEHQAWFGYGVGNWLPAYRIKAQGQISEKMTTPHNDYLLYWFELGLFGLAALLAIWGTQLRLAYRMQQRGPRLHASAVALVTLSMLFAAMFNAILRDGVFAFAMLILLAIPMSSASQSPESMIS